MKHLTRTAPELSKAEILAFERRVDEEHIIGSAFADDPFVDIEGLYPCTVVPRQYLGRVLNVSHNVKLVEMDEIEKILSNENEYRELEPFLGTPGLFSQMVVGRYIDAPKSKVYYNEDESYTPDEANPYVYPTIIFPRKLVGKIVLLWDPNHLQKGR